VMVGQQRLRAHVEERAFESALQQVIDRLAPGPGVSVH